MVNKNKDEEAIFNKAVEFESRDERDAYIAEACGDDKKLRAEVEALLKAHYESGKSFLKAPPGADRTLDSPLAEGPGSRIGRYKLLQLIGEGGFGVVYMAEQQEPINRRVALKIIKLGMDTKQVIARFEAERQALAMMDHPNIARVFDAGATDTGRPYFVMELVKGIPITEYCDKNNLDTQQRLNLFINVCKAVQHAHQKGITHRDIKPSNVMITLHDGKPVPKIIDFGIAKATQHRLTEKTLFTEYRQLIGTPEYMSPEQAEMSGLDVDTRSDIYSLGVLLYELLTGTTPFEAEKLRSAAYDEIRRIICEDEPPKPSTRLNTLGDALSDVAKHRQAQPDQLCRIVRGDLDWVVMRALEKDRTRRYETANEFAGDIERHLGDEPVIAGPPSVGYRLSKFVRRNRASVTAAAVVAAAIIVGLVISTAMYFQAEKARDKEAIARSAAEEAQTAEAKQREVAEEARTAEAQQRQIAEERAEKYRRSLYINSITSADIEYRNKNMSRVCELLESCPEDLRGWEWYRLNHIADQSIMTLQGHTSGTNGVAVSPDGKYIASGSYDKTIKVWNAATGTELMTLRGHNGPVGTVSFSPDGKRIVSGSGDKTVKIWDWASGTELRTLRVQHKMEPDGRLSPDGKYIASWGWDTTIKVWDAETGEEVTALRGGTGVRSVAFSPDGKRIVSGNVDKMIRVWDWATGDEPMILRGHNHVVRSVAFSPDGKKIVSGCYDQTIKIWDAEDGTEAISIDPGTYFFAVEFSPDGKRIVSCGGDGTLKVWDAATGDELMMLGGHVGGVVRAVFSPDGKHVISAGADGTIKVWDPTIVDLKRFTLRRDKKRWVLSLAFSPDGKRIISGGEDKTIKIFDTISGAEIMTLPGHNDRIWSAVYTTDGTRIISCSQDGMIKVWDSVSGAELAVFYNSSGGVFWFAIPSPDGKTVAFSSNGNKSVKLWDLSAKSSAKTLCRHKTVAECGAFSPDGKYIASGEIFGEIKIRDVITGSEVMTLKRNQQGSYIYCIAFSPDGRRIVAGGTELKVWNVETGNEGMTLQGHGGWIEDVVFSPDSKRIIAACNEGIKIWDASTGAEIFSPGESKLGGTVAISPDGKTIATTDLIGKNIILLESVVPTDGYKSRRIVQTARKDVEQLYNKLNSYHNVKDALVTESTLDSPVRTVALQIANARLWEDADMLKEECWKVVRKPDRDIKTYKEALKKAKKAKDLEPDNWSILNTLGVGQYRVGSYDQGLVTLSKAGKIRADNYPEPDHANAAFTAMTLYQLGRIEEAQESIEKLCGLFKENESRGEKRWYPYLFEAEKVLAGKDTKLHSVWESIDDGRLKKAVQLVEELRSSQDAETTARIEGAVKWLGRVYYNRAGGEGHSNTYTKVFADYEAVIAIDPEHAGALNTLAWLRTICPVDEFRDEVKAVNEAAKACELTDWKNHDYISTLAAAYSEIKDLAGAVKWQKKAIELLGEEKIDKRQVNYQERLKLYESGKSYLMDSRWSFSEGELVAHWKFDEVKSGEVLDCTGKGLHGKLVGDANIVTDPERGNVLKIEGDGFVDCGNSPAFDITASITVAVWIKVNASNKEYQTIVSKGPYSWGISGEAFHCEGLSDHICTSLTGDINDGKWHHVVGTYDGQKLCLYIDGNINNSVNATGLINLDQENVYIGTMNREISSEFNGLIDDVRIYSYALSQAEIAALSANKGINQ